MGNAMFLGQRLMITGGTGSFGRQMLFHFLNHTNIEQITVFSRDEEKQDALRNQIMNKRVKFVIGDVRDIGSVSSAIKGNDLVFHAAALKQVPSCEFFPMEAVKTNIQGAENVIRAAIDNGIKKVVVLSTDKAVYPINVMGMSKAIMEKLMIAHSRTTDPEQTILCATRYGNVMASRGSVIPLFIDQIVNGKQITITDPKMTRFLMSLEDSVHLVLYAMENAQSGDIFIQKAPAATIGVIAEALLDIFEAKNEIRIIGTRHGEKAHESLINREEMVKAVDLGGFYRIPADVRDLNYGKYFHDGNVSISSQQEYTSSNTTILNRVQVIELLMGLDIVKNRLQAHKEGKL